MKVRFSYALFALSLLAACSKNDSNVSPSDEVKLSYGDSILYVKDGDADNVVLPQGNLKGTYSGFPEGIELDEATGAINVDKSETGLRYRITFTPDDPSAETLNTVVLLSGISYLDRIYVMENQDTTALPVYNGRTENSVPGRNGSSVFDEGGGCNGAGVVVNANDGTINLVQTLRNGIFGDQPKNGAQKEVEMMYRLSDNSKKAQNRLKVKLYYFDTPEDITADLVQEMTDRRDMFIGLNPQPPFLESFQSYHPPSAGLMISSNSVLGTAKPRPPCIFLVGRASK